MKTIIVPGFWDTALEIRLTADALERSGEKDVIVVDYSDFKAHGDRFNRESFFRLMDAHLGSHAEEYTFIGYSMGAGFVYDYLRRKDITPQKLIVIDPLLQKITNVITSSYNRMLDMHKQGQVKNTFGELKSQTLGIPMALSQFKYNQNIDFDQSLPVNATFLWGEKDVICKISKYTSYKKLFQKTNLITIPNQYHNWLVYPEFVEKYFVPVVLE